MYKKKPADVIYNGFDFDDFSVWFNALSDKEKIFNLSENKFTSLDYLKLIPSREITTHSKAYFGMMSTGNFGSRRNLKSSLDNTKRPNPKKIEEGEEQENYFILAFKTNGDIDMIMQNAGRGIKSLHIKNYFDKYFNIYLASKKISKEFKLIEGAVVSTPDKMINRLDRVIKTKVFIDKSVLNDELDLAQRTLEAKEDIIIDIRARRGQDIRDLLQDIRQKIVHNSKIDKLWVAGKDSNGNISQFYLNQIQKSSYVTIDIDPSTASLVRDDVRRELVKLL
tara:strand:- start:501 stop:1340 length:840 start_codon:yes stop_codon:yes gene_type:complete